MQGVHLRKYGVEATVDFELYEVDGVDLRTDWTPAAADCEIMKDGGASTQCTNTATDEGSTYSIVLTATEMEAARLVLKVVDAATKVFLDKVVMIETYGNASAQHAMDFDDGIRAGLTALPNAAADAAGGLIISDDGGLDADEMYDGIVTDAQGTNVAEDVANMIDANNRVDVGSWLGTAVTTSATSAKPEVDAFSVSDDATAANNLESQYDTTGLTGDTFPATQAAVGNIASGTAAINTTAESFTKAGAEPETNTYTATVAEDGTYHIVEDDGGATDCYYQFDVGGSGIPVSVTWIGYAQSNGDSYTIWAYNYGTTTYEQIGTKIGLNGTTPVTATYDLTNAHVGTGANIGKVRFRFLSADGTAFATDRVLCSYAVIAQSVGYANGAIWVDSAGTAGSENYVNGTADNPCPWANALTISASLGIKRFHIANDVTVTLSAALDDSTIFGEHWYLALGGQSINDTLIEGCAQITGIGSAADHVELHNCYLGAGTYPPGRYINCGFGLSDGLFTAASDGEYVFKSCFSLVAGAGTPDFTFAGLGSATGINNRGWTGGIAYTLDSNCTLSHEVLAGGGTSVTTGGASVEVRGICRSLTAVLSAAETLQFVGVVGPVNLSGTTTATVNLYGVTGSITDSTSAASVTVETASEDRLAELDAVNIPADIDTLITGVDLNDDAITSAKYDESTAFPLAKADSGNDEVARTGADGDTLETLSDQLDGISANAIADQVWEEAIADHSGTAGSTAEQLAAAGAGGDPWATALPGAYGAGTAGKIIGDNVDAVLSEIETDVATVDTNVDAVLEDTSTTIPAQITALNDPTAAEITDAVWDETVADHSNVGSTGAALAAAGNSGDPWATPVPGDYTSGTAGYKFTELADTANITTVEASIDIFNQALGHIGEYEVSETQTTTKQYKLCDRYYTQALKKAIAKHPWNETIEDTIIMQDTVAPLTEFDYRYAKPTDCVTVMGIGTDLKHWEVRGQYIETDYFRTPTPWATGIAYVEGQYIQYDSVTYVCGTSHTSSVWADESAYWTSQSGDYVVIDVTYRKLLTTVSEMSAELIDTVSYELAILIATALTGDQKVKKEIVEEYEKIRLPQSRSVDAVEGRLRSKRSSSWKRSRS